MAEEIKEVTAIVYKQFRLKWQEVGKSSVNAGIAAFLALIGTSIYAGRFPTLVELKTAGAAGILAMLGSLIRYLVNPTNTVIQGQVEPKIMMPKPDTVVSKDIAPNEDKKPE